MKIQLEFDTYLNGIIKNDLEMVGGTLFFSLYRGLDLNLAKFRHLMSAAECYR